MKGLIVLTGFMGTGKTEVGKVLAKRLGRNFFDTDALIEKKMRMSISDIFREFKEEGFRKIETDILIKIAKEKTGVISCGGGVVLNKKNIEILRENGIIVNLRASCDVIYERIKNSDVCKQNLPAQKVNLCSDTENNNKLKAQKRHEFTNRPLMRCKDHLFKIRELLDDRKELYANCDLSLNTDGLSIQEVVLVIINKIGYIVL